MVNEIKGQGVVIGSGAYALHLLDLSREQRRAQYAARALEMDGIFGQLAEARLIADGFLPSCYLKEHRHGICPDGHHHPTKETRGHNTIVRSLRESICLQMTGLGTPISLAITMLGFGTSADPTAQTQTQLVVETYRKAPSDRLNPSVNSVQIYGNLTASEGNAGSNLQEYGIFAGGATSTPSSGTMIARFLQDFDKNSGNIASLSYLATFN